MYTYKNFTFSFSDPQQAAKWEKNRLSVIACRNRKAQAEAAAAAKVVEDKEEMGRRHAQEILEIKQSMAAMMEKKYGEKKQNKKRKHYTSSEDYSSDSEESAEVCLSSHSDKKRKKTSMPKRHRRSPTPPSLSPPLTVAKGKAMSPPPHALTRTGSDHSELQCDSDPYDGRSDGGSSSVSDCQLGRNQTTTTAAAPTITTAAPTNQTQHLWRHWLVKSFLI